MPVSCGSKCVPGAEFGGTCLRRQYAELRSNLADAQQAGIASKLHVCNAALRVNISVLCTPWAQQGDSFLRCLCCRRSTTPNSIFHGSLRPCTTKDACDLRDVDGVCRCLQSDVSQWDAPVRSVCRDLFLPSHNGLSCCGKTHLQACKKLSEGIRKGVLLESGKLISLTFRKKDRIAEGQKADPIALQ